MKNNRKIKIIAILLSLILLFSFFIWLTIKINDWFNTHFIRFQSPIVLKLQKPVEVEKRSKKIEYIIKYAESLPKPETPLEEYICKKFGSDCQIAIAIARAESGMREDAWNINSNRTLDLGIFQINSVHWEKEGCSPKELFDARKNVDCAYKIYKSSGWGAWTVAKNGAFVKFLQ